MTTNHQQKLLAVVLSIKKNLFPKVWWLRFDAKGGVIVFVVVAWC